MPDRACWLLSLALLSTPSSAPAQTPPTCDPEAVPPEASAPLRRDVLGGTLRSCGQIVPVSARQQCENLAAPPCQVDPRATQIAFELRWTRAGTSVSLAGPTPYMTRWPTVRASARGPYRIFEVTLTTEHYGRSRTTVYMVLLHDRVVFDELLQECSNSGARWDCGRRARVAWVNRHTLRLRTRAGTRTVDLRSAARAAVVEAQEAGSLCLGPFRERAETRREIRPSHGTVPIRREVRVPTMCVKPLQRRHFARDRDPCLRDSWD